MRLSKYRSRKATNLFFENKLTKNPLEFGVLMYGLFL